MESGGLSRVHVPSPQFSLGPWDWRRCPRRLENSMSLWEVGGYTAFRVSPAGLQARNVTTSTLLPCLKFFTDSLMPESKTIAPFPSPSHLPLSWRGTRNRTSAWMVSSQAPFLKATVEKGWGPKALPKGRRPLRQLLLSCSVTSNSLRPHGWQHARHPCPSLFPKVCPNSLSWWCHPTVSSSVVPFSSCPQSFPVSGSFPVSRLFASGGQSIGASASVLPMNIQGWFPLGLTGFDLLAVQGTLESSPAPQFESIRSQAVLPLITLLLTADTTLGCISAVDKLWPHCVYGCFLFLWMLRWRLTLRMMLKNRYRGNNFHLHARGKVSRR